jgi:hypothetical protein
VLAVEREIEFSGMFVSSLLWSMGQRSWLQNGDVLFPVRYELNSYVM